MSRISPKLIIPDRDNIDAPAHLECPLCLCIFNQPVMDTCGHTYDYDCIKTHLANDQRCPESRQTLRLSDLRNNLLALAGVESFLAEQKIKVKDVAVDLPPQLPVQTPQPSSPPPIVALETTIRNLENDYWEDPIIITNTPKIRKRCSQIPRNFDPRLDDAFFEFARTNPTASQVLFEALMRCHYVLIIMYLEHVDVKGDPRYFKIAVIYCDVIVVRWLLEDGAVYNKRFVCGLYNAARTGFQGIDYSHLEELIEEFGGHENQKKSCMVM